MHIHELTGDVTGVMRACGNDVIAAHAVNSESCRFPCNTFECLLRIVAPFCVPIADCCLSLSSILYWDLLLSLFARATDRLSPAIITLVNRRRKNHLGNTARSTQAPRHHPERGSLHCPIWKAIGCYPLRNCLLDPVVQLSISPVGRGNKCASHEGSVPSCFLLHWRWSWQLVDREGLTIGLRLRSKGGSSCNVLGSCNVVGLNVSCRAGP